LEDAHLAEEVTWTQAGKLHFVRRALLLYYAHFTFADQVEAVPAFALVHDEVAGFHVQFPSVFHEEIDGLITQACKDGDALKLGVHGCNLRQILGFYEAYRLPGTVIQSQQVPPPHVGCYNGCDCKRVRQSDRRGLGLVQPGGR
ncbi:MAG: hypothetical protein WC869_17160, partial [Phycisphaerae bacterium]